ncbi:uncharacterized protein LOC128859189 [Anastrepha ludens]|uniref:uncharacterized protein LOC128859189 n=1 Tax=Anastrepha ludens TaxID=28586 RepID=UPI0023B1010C|nr:uncharacterized protein LOC128859189 [Anastrepha ludens]
MPDEIHGNPRDVISSTDSNVDALQASSAATNAEPKPTITKWAEYSRNYRQRQKLARPPKPPPKTRAAISKAYRERQKLSKSIETGAANIMPSKEKQQRKVAQPNMPVAPVLSPDDGPQHIQHTVQVHRQSQPITQNVARKTTAQRKKSTKINNRNISQMNLDEIQEAPIQQPRTTNGIDGIREAPIRRLRTPHGIDEIQDAPVQNARTTHTNHANRNDWDNELDDRSNSIRTQKKCKDIFKHDAETEIVLEPEADIEIQKEIVPPTVGSALPERPGFSSGQGLSLRHMYGNVINVDTTTTTIKKEIDCFDDDDINKVTAICEDISDEDSKPDAILDFEAEMDMKTEIELANEEYTTSELNTPTSSGLSLRHMYGNVINVDTTTTTIKKEIDCFDDDDINKVTAICEDISDEDSKPDAVEAEMDMKTEIELANEEYTTSELNTPTSLINVPTLGFPVTTQSQICVTLRPNTSLNATMLASGEADRATTSDKSKKSVEKACKKSKIAVLPCPSDITNASDVGHKERRVFTISPPSTSLNISTQATVDTAKDEKSVLSHPSPTTAKEVTGTESFNTKHSTHTSVPEDTTNGSKKRKITSLNEMYEIVLKSINKRDEREEQMMGILQGLTVAVTRLTDNVQRLEEVLTFCKNN